MEHEGLFGTHHLAALALVAATALASVLVLRHSGRRLSGGICAVLAVALGSTHILENAVALAQGWYRREMLPLQLCDVAAMLAVVALLSRNRRVVEPLYFFALSGTLPALLTPELDVGFPHFRYVVYFVEHGLTVVAPLALVFGLGVRPRPRAWLRAVVQVHAVAAVAALANLALGTNFLYLGAKPRTPTPFDLFGPWPWYLLVLEALVVVVFRSLQALLPGSLPARRTPRWRRLLAACTGRRTCENGLC